MHTYTFTIIMVSDRLSETCVAERFPAQVAEHLSDAADVMPAIAGLSGCSALDDIELVNIFLGL